MSEAVDHGITVTEIAAMDQPIDVCPETTAAFVGRALRGPLDTPVLVKNFAEFRRRFGDIWSRSSLGPAVKQFFDHGGLRLYIVRVANNARGALLCLPASGAALVLRVVEPGSTEYVRAAVDYDGIDDEDDDLFNLTLQRINPATGLVLDQEFFQGLSWREDATFNVADQLLSSELARVEQPYPAHRPERTTVPGRSYEPAYVDHAQAGSDGSALSDYDLVGSRREHSGLFALAEIERFDLLYLPPPGKGQDIGPAAVLAAERYSRERGAMMIVDPPLQWSTPDEAVSAVRDLGYASPNMLAYYPRVTERGGDNAVRPAGGAIAGLLCKHDRSYGPWQALEGMGLQRKLRPAVELTEGETRQLNRAGLNVLLRGATQSTHLSGSVTLARGSEADRQYLQLPVRRFCLQIISTIARATRWAVFEAVDVTLAKRLRGQVLTYLHCLNDLGAFVNDDFVVQCDAGVSKREDSEQHGVTILLVFHPLACAEPISLTLHQTASGLRVGSTAFGLTRIQ